jgi:hypothetical protein
MTQHGGTLRRFSEGAAAGRLAVCQWLKDKRQGALRPREGEG